MKRSQKLQELIDRGGVLLLRNRDDEMDDLVERGLVRRTFNDKIGLYRYSPTRAAYENPANPLALRDYSAYCQEIARRYDEMPAFDPSEVWRWELLIESVEDFYKKMVKEVDVRFVEGQPYETAQQMREAVRRTGVLEISTDSNEHEVFTPQQNLKFRAVHDYIVHIMPGKGGPDFTERGEIRAYNLHRRLAPRDSWPALFTEVAAQACYRNERGVFPPQKIAVMPGVDFYDVGRLSGFDVEAKELRAANPDADEEFEAFNAWVIEVGRRKREFIEQKRRAFKRDGYTLVPSYNLDRYKSVLTKSARPGAVYQVTDFEGDEPVGHREYRTLDAALEGLWDVASKSVTKLPPSPNPGAHPRDLHLAYRLAQGGR